MNTTNIQAVEVRKKLGEILELAYYQSQQFRIARKNKPMARIVGEPFMRVIDQLIEDDPGLADTIAIMLNDEVYGEIKASIKEEKAGKLRPVSQVFDELRSSSDK